MKTVRVDYACSSSTHPVGRWSWPVRWLSRASAVGVGCAVALSAMPHASADDPQAVVVSSIGPKGMHLRVAAGSVMPCSSSSDQKLFDGELPANQEVYLQTPQSCVCVEHTFDAFADKDWSSPELVCRPTVCTGAGKYRVCVPASDQTIRVVVSSTR